MWDEIRKYSGKFAGAVLTGVDADGYPFSVRCVPQFDDRARVIRVTMATGAAIQPGRAGLLYHQHNEQLWNLRMFLVRGCVERDDQGWIFYPEQLIPGSGLRPAHDMLAIVRVRRAAKRYLQKRGLARPKIPWADIKALYPSTKSKR